MNSDTNRESSPSRLSHHSIGINVDSELKEPIATEEELRDLAEDIVRYCPSLTHLLLAFGSKKKSNPLKGLN